MNTSVQLFVCTCKFTSIDISWFPYVCEACEQHSKYSDAHTLATYLVCNAYTVLQEGDVRQLFAPFGQITSVSIMKDNNGQSQGYGYVEFSSMPDASKAMQQWDGQEVVGQKLSVKVANMGPASVMPQLDLDDDEGIPGVSVHCITLLTSPALVIKAQRLQLYIS